MNQNELYNTMTDAEIKQCLKDFKKYLGSKDNILQIDGTKADPIKENCYISSGSIAGVYFPNSIIKLNDNVYKYYNAYNFVCIGKNNRGENGFYLSLKDDHRDENGNGKGFFNFQEYTFKEFEYIPNDYFKIKDEIIKDINQFKKEIEILKTFKLTPKKDGTPRENFRLNFEYTQIYKYYDGTQKTEIKKPDFSADFAFNNGGLISFNIIFEYSFKIHHRLTDEETKQKYYSIESYATLDKIYTIVMDSLKEKENRLKQLETLLKDSLKIFREAEKAKKQYISIKENINNKSNYYFNEYITKNLY